jgi:hypothetical protein
MTAREKLLRRLIEHAWRMSAYYRALNDPDSAWVFESWAWDAELELWETSARRRRAV